MNEAASKQAGGWQWPSTEWSASGRLPRSLENEPRRLNELILRYQTPLKAYLLAAFPGMGDRVDELLQDFLQDRVLKGGWLGKAERQRGRFRDLLKTSLRNFVRDRLRATPASPVSLNDLQIELPAEESGTDAFGLEWARIVLAEALRRMEADCRAPLGKGSNRLHIWEVFRLRLLQPILEGAEPVGYQELVSRLGIVSPFAAQNLLATAKRIFSRHLETVIGEYEEQGRAAVIEVQELRTFLGGLACAKRSETPGRKRDEFQE